MDRVDGSLSRIDIVRAHEGDKYPAEDIVAREEPLWIGLNGRTVACLMRLPGDEEFLAVGYCFSEGFIQDREQVRFVNFIEESDSKADWSDGSQPDDAGLSGRLFGEERGELESSRSMVRDVVEVSADISGEPAGIEIGPVACRGSAGGGLAADVDVSSIRVENEERFPSEVLIAAPGKLLEEQHVFSSTGGTHGAGVFDVAGNVLSVKEDVGRHNALDKVMGELFMSGEMSSGKGLVISGRLSYEMVLKGACAGIPLICSISAPTSLGVELARRTGVTLIGFLRDRGFNIYSHPERVGGAGWPRV